MKIVVKYRVKKNAHELVVEYDCNKVSPSDIMITKSLCEKNDGYFEVIEFKD